MSGTSLDLRASEHTGNPTVYGPANTTQQYAQAHVVLSSAYDSLKQRLQRTEQENSELRRELKSMAHQNAHGTPPRSPLHLSQPVSVNTGYPPTLKRGSIPNPVAGVNGHSPLGSSQNGRGAPHASIIRNQTGSTVQQARMSPSKNATSTEPNESIMRQSQVNRVVREEGSLSWSHSNENKSEYFRLMEVQVQKITEEKDQIESELKEVRVKLTTSELQKNELANKMEALTRKCDTLYLEKEGATARVKDLERQMQQQQQLLQQQQAWQHQQQAQENGGQDEKSALTTEVQHLMALALQARNEQNVIGKLFKRERAVMEKLTARFRRRDKRPPKDMARAGEVDAEHSLICQEQDQFTGAGDNLGDFYKAGTTPAANLTTSHLSNAVTKGLESATSPDDEPQRSPFEEPYLNLYDNTSHFAYLPIRTEEGSSQTKASNYTNAPAASMATTAAGAQHLQHNIPTVTSEIDNGNRDVHGMATFCDEEEQTMTTMTELNSEDIVINLEPSAPTARRSQANASRKIDVTATVKKAAIVQPTPRVACEESENRAIMVLLERNPTTGDAASASDNIYSSTEGLELSDLPSDPPPPRPCMRVSAMRSTADTTPAQAVETSTSSDDVTVRRPPDVEAFNMAARGEQYPLDRADNSNMVDVNRASGQGEGARVPEEYLTVPPSPTRTEKSSGYRHENIYTPDPTEFNNRARINADDGGKQNSPDVRPKQSNLLQDTRQRGGGVTGDLSTMAKSNSFPRNQSHTLRLSSNSFSGSSSGNRTAKETEEAERRRTDPGYVNTDLNLQLQNTHRPIVLSSKTTWDGPRDYAPIRSSQHLTNENQAGLRLANHQQPPQNVYTQPPPPLSLALTHTTNPATIQYLTPTTGNTQQFSSYKQSPVENEENQSNEHEQWRPAPEGQVAPSTYENLPTKRNSRVENLPTTRNPHFDNQPTKRNPHLENLPTTRNPLSERLPPHRSSPFDRGGGASNTSATGVGEGIVGHCIICNVPFRKDFSIQDRERHINACLSRSPGALPPGAQERQCPVCQETFSKEKDICEFETHVNSHFNDEFVMVQR